MGDRAQEGTGAPCPVGAATLRDQVKMEVWWPGRWSQGNRCHLYPLRLFLPQRYAPPGDRTRRTGDKRGTCARCCAETAHECHPIPTPRPFASHDQAWTAGLDHPSHVLARAQPHTAVPKED